MNVPLLSSVFLLLLTVTLFSPPLSPLALTDVSELRRSDSPVSLAHSLCHRRPPCHRLCRRQREPVNQRLRSWSSSTLLVAVVSWLNTITRRTLRSDHRTSQ